MRHLLVSCYLAMAISGGSPSMAQDLAGSGSQLSDFIYKTPPSYHSHSPQPHSNAYHEIEEPPQPFQYQYGVFDEKSGASFDKHEAQDGYGNLKGSYRVNLPDGRVQIVEYRATHDGGFQANVRYEGEASYPDRRPYHGGYSQPSYRY